MSERVISGKMARQDPIFQLFSRLSAAALASEYNLRGHKRLIKCQKRTIMALIVPSFVSDFKVSSERAKSRA
jgi:hypothetical protein